MRRLWLAVGFVFALTSGAAAQTCGDQNPNCIVPTAPVGTNNNQAASTAFVQQNAAPSALPNGELFVGNASNLAAAQALSGDCTISNAGVITCTKTGGVAFATLATKVSPVCSDLTNAAASCSTDTTNASNISTGTLGSGLLPSPFTSGTATGSTSKFATSTGTLTSGDCVKLDASGNFIDSGGPCGGSVSAPTVQRFTSGTSLTYTPTAGTVRIQVRMCAGGGGGGAQATNAGGSGGATSFGSWTTGAGSGGGAGGASGAVGGNGGSGGTNGTGTLVFRVSGGSGTGAASNGTSGQYAGGSGGSGPLGGAGGGGTNGGGAAHAAAANTCSGGGGAGGGANGGGGGGAGEYVEFWMTAAQVGASQTYTVGTAGSGGAAGTVAGGNGAAGIIIIVEYYI